MHHPETAVADHVLSQGLDDAEAVLPVPHASQGVQGLATNEAARDGAINAGTRCFA